MPDDNVIKFRPAKKKPAPRPQPGQPSLRVAIIVGAIVLALVAAIGWWFGGIR